MIIMEKVLNGKGLGKFRGSAEAALFFIGCPHQMFVDLPEGILIKDTGVRSVGKSSNPRRSADPEGVGPCHMLGKALRLLFYLVSFFPEGSGYRSQHVCPGRTVVYGTGRDIGAPIKGPALRCQKYVQRPAAATGDNLYRIQIDMVEVGPFFPDLLNVDEMIVHN